MIKRETARAAVMIAPNEELELREYPIPPAPAGGALVRISCCTICRSDLHTWAGRRPAKTPVILGHEIVGRIVALDKKLTHDGHGSKLSLGDRVTWTLHNSCGKCRNCCHYGLPMKCEKLRKYGHEPCDKAPHLQGGFAEYCVIDAGTTIFRIPDHLSDAVAAQANCAVATVIAGWDAAGLSSGDRVLIQGAGALGCYAAAFASHVGCGQIIVSDISAERLDFVRHFGATECINCTDTPDEQFAEMIKERTNGEGVDLVLELAGVPSVVAPGLAALRVGGRYVEIGCVFPNAYAAIDLSIVLRNLLTITGVHNYEARHLAHAIRFLAATQSTRPYDAISGATYDLAHINQAVIAAETTVGTRIAVSCS